MAAPLYDHPAICQTYFFPMPGGPLPAGPRSAPVPLNLPDGTAIGGYWARPLQRAPTLLYLHGNGECIADQLEHWPRWAEDAGANVFFVDYPGYASSRGVPSFTSCRQAARAGLEYLLSRPAEQVPSVVLAGRSVGSIFALDAAAAAADDPRLRGLLLESGIADVAPRLAMRVDYKREGINRATLEAQLSQEFDHQRKLAALRCPVLVLHTRHDGLVPAHNGEQLARWAGDGLFRLVLFERGDHNTIQWINQAAYRQHLGQFLAASSPEPGA